MKIVGSYNNLDILSKRTQTRFHSIATREPPRAFFEKKSVAVDFFSQKKKLRRPLLHCSILFKFLSSVLLCCSVFFWLFPFNLTGKTCDTPLALSLPSPMSPQLPLYDTPCSLFPFM